MAQPTIGRYQIRQELGQSEIGVVYLAYDPLLKREVAIKVLQPQLFAEDPQLAKRFEQEAEIIASLEHHSIIPLYDFGQNGEMRYFVRRFMKGGTLGDRLATGPLALDETIAVLGRVGSALDKAHGRGVIHRDLKPNNILFDEGGFAYLSDFGIIKTENLPRSQSEAVQITGAPAYMSPEQLDGGTVDKSSDIYSLGIVLYEMLTGKKPFDHTSVARVIVMHLTQPVPDALLANPALPPSVNTVIQKAMAKEPENRYPTAGAMFLALESLAAQPADQSADSQASPAKGGKSTILSGEKTPDVADKQGAAAAFAQVGKHVEAAELWCQVNDLQQAAEQYELGGRWSEAANLWLQLDRYDRRANASHQYAQFLSQQPVGDEEKAIAWERAASAYVEMGDKEAQAKCEREVARYRRQPILILDIEPKEVLLEVWSKVDYTVRNDGFASARFLTVNLISGHFEGKGVRTLTMRTLKPGETFTYWVDAYPHRQGERVPLQLLIEYMDKNDQRHKLERTFSLLVSDKESAKPVPPTATTPDIAEEAIQETDTRRLLNLRNQMVQLFTESELHDICLELSVDPETFDESKPTFVRELIFYLLRRGRLPELIHICKRDRPHVAW